MAMVLTEGKDAQGLLGLIFCNPQADGAGPPQGLSREAVSPDDGAAFAARFAVDPSRQQARPAPGIDRPARPPKRLLPCDGGQAILRR